jgi:hypothetical protein
MADQTRFDLNRALAAWKGELSAQPEISAQDLRELETHLLECFEARCRSGVSEPEAFAAAVRQMGSPERLAVEFAKANPLRTWPSRVFLMVLAGLMVWAWTESPIRCCWNECILEASSPGFIALGLVFNGVLPLLLILLAVNGRATCMLRALGALQQSLVIPGRYRFVCSTSLLRGCLGCLA